MIEPHRDHINAQLNAQVTVATIHQRLTAEHGLDASVASLRRWVRANLPETARRAQVTVLRDAPPPGEQAQIDYGKLGMWLDPATGRRRAVWAFAGGAGLLPAHVRAPDPGDGSGRVDRRPCGGVRVLRWVPARLVPDNLKTGVDKPDLYDPKINRSYAELAAHYGVLIDPARAFKPKDKPQVERPMPYVRDSFWRGREFTSLEAMRVDAVRWSREVAGARSCRPLDGAAPAAVFAAVEAPTLRLLPTSGFVLASWSRPMVGPDIHAKVDATLYSIPWRHLGQRVDARATSSMVQFFVDGQLIKPHPRKQRGKQTDFGDYPPEKIAFHMRTPTWCRSKATEIGPACQVVIGELLAENALFRLRAAQGVLGLADKHDPGRLEAACATATAAGDPSYRTIKGILVAGTETTPAARPTGDGGASAHLHGPEQLFADARPPAHRGQGEPRTQGHHRRPGRRPHPSDQPERRVMTTVTTTATTADRSTSATASAVSQPTAANPATGASQTGPSMSSPTTTIIDTNALTAALRTLKLSGMLGTLDARLAQARAGELGHLEFLQVLCHDEIARRDATAIGRRTRRARFEQTLTLEGFDFTANPKLPAAAVRDLAALRWVQAGQSVILYGPVGGRQDPHRPRPRTPRRARRRRRPRHQDQPRPGRPRRRARRRHLDPPATRARPPRAAHPRRLRHARAHRTQADDLYELINERAGRSMILTSNRSPVDWYPLFPNPIVAESLLDRLINNSHQLFMD